MSIFLIPVILLVSGGDVDDWRWQPGVGFVNSETMEKKSDEKFYEYGLSLASERKTDEALRVMHLILTHVRDRKTQEKVLFTRGKILWSGSRFNEAFLALDDFLRKFPESNMAEEAKILEMDCALLLAKKGETGSFWGKVPVVKWFVNSPKKGVELLRMTLQRYPREPFSSLYYYKLAEFFFEEEDFDDASKELKFLLEEYPATVEAPKAILLLGKIGLKKFDSIDYDIHGLKEARRHFARFIEEAPIFSKISPAVAKFIQESLPYAKEKISFLNDKEAEKEYRVGEYYRGKGFFRSARIYYESVRKRYPGTEWAEKARTRLSETSP